jgi:hypothetical protein
MSTHDAIWIFQTEVLTMGKFNCTVKFSLPTCCGQVHAVVVLADVAAKHLPRVRIPLHAIAHFDLCRELHQPAALTEAIPNNQASRVYVFFSVNFDSHRYLCFCDSKQQDAVQVQGRSWLERDSRKQLVQPELIQPELIQLIQPELIQLIQPELIQRIQLIQPELIQRIQRELIQRIQRELVQRELIQRELIALASRSACLCEPGECRCQANQRHPVLVIIATMPENARGCGLFYENAGTARSQRA